MPEKVYLLDYDIISPLGLGKEAILSSLKSNVEMNNPITRFSIEGLTDAIAAEAGQLPSLYRKEREEIKQAVKYDRKFELTVATYHLMEERLQTICQKVNDERCGVVFGSGIDVTPFEILEEEMEALDEALANPAHHLAHKMNIGDHRLNALFNPLDVSAIYLAEKLGLGAFQKTTLTACTASTQAITYACDTIKRGEADLVIAGGSDSIINQLAFMAFSKLGIIAPLKSDTENACKPLDVNRSGTLAGEAAGICVLVSESLVKELKLNPLFEMIGYGNSLDGYKITAPDPEGKGMKKAMAQAVNRAKVSAHEIDYINLHGTGTYANDTVELNSLVEVLGKGVEEIPMSSTKDRHGHAIAAAGIQELGVLCIAMENNFIPCNYNLSKPIRKDLNLIMSVNRNGPLNIGMTNNFAFGGMNTSLIIKKMNHNYQK